MTPEIYTHGHHESVLRNHTWRTAENSAGYILGRLRPGLDLLDVGCGPGTITVDLARRNGGEPDAGRFLKTWARAAGFDDVEAGSSTWTFADPASCAWWGGSWADRCELSSFGEQAIAYGLSTRDELSAIATAFRTWSTRPDAFFLVPHGEVVALRR